MTTPIRQFSLLLVEDDDVDIMNVKRALKKNNLELPLYLASNGVEALDMLHQRLVGATGGFDKLLIMLDLNMPRMGGLEFLKILRSNPAFHKIPVIVLTTSNHQHDLEAAYALNISGYIVKPVEFRSFVEIIDVVSRYWSLCEIPD